MRRSQALVRRGNRIVGRRRVWNQGIPLLFWPQRVAGTSAGKCSSLASRSAQSYQRSASMPSADPDAVIAALAHGLAQMVDPDAVPGSTRRCGVTEFAIALEQVVADKAPKDYTDPKEFFKCTGFARAIGAVKRRWFLLAEANGGGGIRTPGTVSRTTVFKTVAFSHSATPPWSRPCGGVWLGSAVRFEAVGAGEDGTAGAG